MKNTKIFLTSFFQIGFVAVNTVLIAKGIVIGIFITSFIISLLWSVACIYFLGYILVHYGAQKEILTLIIGLIGGTIIGGIFAHYFCSTHRPNRPEEEDKSNDPPGNDITTI